MGNNGDLIVWDEKYAVGIKLIDNQHRQLVKLTNELHRDCIGRNTEIETVFREAMSRMVEYVRFHFSAEQQLLERIKFPGYIDHKKRHEALIKDILDAAKDFNEGRKFVPNNFVRTLRDWIFSHIAIYDKVYASFVADQKKKGLLTDKQING